MTFSKYLSLSMKKGKNFLGYLAHKLVHISFTIRVSRVHFVRDVAHVMAGSRTG